MSDLFYNDVLKEFEKLNTTTDNVYELGEYDNLIILKNGENHTDFSSIESLEDIIFISQDVSTFNELSNRYCLNNLTFFRRENPLKNLKAIVPLNVNDKINSLRGMFCNLNSLKTVSGLDTWNTFNVSDFSFMFSNCINLKTIHGLDSFNLEKAEKMHNMFHKCENLSDLSQISAWDVSNVKDMKYMFSNCKNLKSLSPIKNWNLSTDCSFSTMFDKCSFDLRMEFYNMWESQLEKSFAEIFPELNPRFNVNDYKCPNCGCFNMKYDDFKLTCRNCGDIIYEYVHNCPDCGSSKLVFKNMELICRDCGLIISPYNFKSFKDTVDDDNESLFKRLDALDKINNDLILLEIILDSSVSDIKRKACTKLKNQTILRNLALNHPEGEIRLIACKKISDNFTLAQLVDDEELVSMEAMSKKQMMKF